MDRADGSFSKGGLRWRIALIFVITGTHEQQFQRLVEASDLLAAAGLDVLVQYGYSSPPSRARGVHMLGTFELKSAVRTADIIVTHGGPGAMWEAFNDNKVPVVVPRLKRFNEHVDDHQVAFIRHMARHKRVISVSDPVHELLDVIQNFDYLSRNCAPPRDSALQNREALRVFLNTWLETS